MLPSISCLTHSALLEGEVWESGALEQNRGPRLSGPKCQLCPRRLCDAGRVTELLWVSFSPFIK